MWPWPSSSNEILLRMSSLNHGLAMFQMIEKYDGYGNLTAEDTKKELAGNIQCFGRALSGCEADGHLADNKGALYRVAMRAMLKPG